VTSSGTCRRGSFLAACGQQWRRGTAGRASGAAGAAGVGNDREADRQTDRQTDRQADRYPTLALAGKGNRRPSSGVRGLRLALSDAVQSALSVIPAGLISPFPDRS